MMDRISICEALAKWNENDTFLKWMVTGDEKWVTYYNIVRKRSWSKCSEAAQIVAKPGLLAMKKWPEFANRRSVVFQYDNARPHTSVVTHRISGSWFGNFIHPQYGLDLTPNDYQLFIVLQNFLSDKKLGSKEDCEI
ncbi:transposase [Trichonephila clavipes]|nr:transposase [Trichonephila clavipes]